MTETGRVDLRPYSDLFTSGERRVMYGLRHPVNDDAQTTERDASA